MNVKRIAGGGLLLTTVMATAIAITPVLAAGAPPAAATGSAPRQQAFSIRCAEEWLAARADPSVATVRAVGDCEIARRLDTIAKLRTTIADAKALTDEHRSALASILDRSQSGLTTLKATIDAETSLAPLRTDVHAIFADYRIYALVGRQVALVRGDDAVSHASDRLDAAAAKIQAAIAKAQENGKDVTAATQHLTAMETAIAGARSQVDGDAAQVLPLTPAEWNAGTAKSVLDAARASITSARSDLATALTEAKAAVAALK